MIKKSEITKARRELNQWLRQGYRRTGVLMLDKSDGHVWADVFLDEGSYKIYHSSDIVEIPMAGIMWRNTVDHPMTAKEQDKSIYQWCLEQMEKKGEETMCEKKKYRVQVVKYGYADIDADSAEEARRKTDNMWDGEFDWAERDWRDAEIVEED